MLAPLVGPSTAVMTLQNGLGNEELLAKEFGEEKILGGSCFVCLNRVQAGVVHHLAHGNIVMGEYRRWPEPRTHDIASAFRNAGVACKVADNLEWAHWEKLVWNIPFNGLGVAGAAGYEAVATGVVRERAVPGLCVDTQQLLGDPRWEGFVRELMREVIATANALGFKLEDSLVEMHIGRTRRMGAYKASTLLDFEKGLPLEVNTLFLEPLRQARAVGVKSPRLEALYAVLTSLESIRKQQPSTAA
jgi:2-dehydropantoate 2-reductase